MHYGEFAFRNKEWGGIASQATRTLYPNPLSVSSVMVWPRKIFDPAYNNFSVQMQKENFGKGVTIGQRIGLSFCDELKLRRFYAEPGIRGRKQCEIWSPRFWALCQCVIINSQSCRTCKCRDYAGETPEGYNDTLCQSLIDQYDKENPPIHVQ